MAMKTGIAAGAGGAVLSEPVKAKAGSGAFLQQLENQRALKVGNGILSLISVLRVLM